MLNHFQEAWRSYRQQVKELNLRAGKVVTEFPTKELLTKTFQLATNGATNPTQIENWSELFPPEINQELWLQVHKDNPSQIMFTDKDGAQGYNLIYQETDGEYQVLLTLTYERYIKLVTIPTIPSGRKILVRIILPGFDDIEGFDKQTLDEKLEPFRTELDKQEKQRQYTAKHNVYREELLAHLFTQTYQDSKAQVEAIFAEAKELLGAMLLKLGACDFFGYDVLEAIFKSEYEKADKLFARFEALEAERRQKELAQKLRLVQVKEQNRITPFYNALEIYPSVFYRMYEDGSHYSDLAQTIRDSGGSVVIQETKIESLVVATVTAKLDWSSIEFSFDVLVDEIPSGQPITTFKWKKPTANSKAILAKQAEIAKLQSRIQTLIQSKVKSASLTESAEEAWLFREDTAQPIDHQDVFLIEEIVEIKFKGQLVKASKPIFDKPSGTAVQFILGDNVPQGATNFFVEAILTGPNGFLTNDFQKVFGVNQQLFVYQANVLRTASLIDQEIKQEEVVLAELQKQLEELEQTPEESAQTAKAPKAHKAKAPKPQVAEAAQDNTWGAFRLAGR